MVFLYHYPLCEKNAIAAAGGGQWRVRLTFLFWQLVALSDLNRVGNAQCAAGNNNP